MVGCAVAVLSLCPSYQEVLAIRICLVASLRSQKLKVELKASVGVHHRAALRHKDMFDMFIIFTNSFFIIIIIYIFPRNIFSNCCLISVNTYIKHRIWICCNIAELTLSFSVVLMAQAALVSHMKLAVQFWYIRNRGPIDCTVWNTKQSHISDTCKALTSHAPIYCINCTDSPKFLWSRPGGCVLCMWASGRLICRQSRLWTPAAGGLAPQWSALAWKYPCCWLIQPPLESPEDRGEERASKTHLKCYVPLTGYYICCPSIMNLGGRMKLCTEALRGKWEKSDRSIVFSPVFKT